MFQKLASVSVTLTNKEVLNVVKTTSESLDSKKKKKSVKNNFI